MPSAYHRPTSNEETKIEKTKKKGNTEAVRKGGVRGKKAFFDREISGWVFIQIKLMKYILLKC